MTSELTKLFSKSFVIGFVLPAAAFMLAVFTILYAFNETGRIVAAIDVQKFETAFLALTSFVVWFAAVTLLALNRQIVRLLEGYGALNPFRLNQPRMQSSFQKLNRRITEGRRKRDDAKKQERAFEGKDLEQYRDAVWQMARCFPDNEIHVLPTKFGNSMRAYQVYSRVVYGMEAEYTWNRLLSVVPTDYRDMIDNEKAQMDFWVNLWFASCLTVVVYAALAIATFNDAIEGAKFSWFSLWIPAAAVAIGLFATKSAHSVAHSLGILMTSAFDLFRSDLCRKLGYQMPQSIEQERELWLALSQVWVFRSAEVTERLNKFRLHE